MEALLKLVCVLWWSRNIFLIFARKNKMQHSMCREISRDLIDHFEWYRRSAKTFHKVVIVEETLTRAYLTLLCAVCKAMGLLPKTNNCGCACAGNAGNVFPATAGKQSRHASRHVRHARAVMHAGIANSRFPLNSAAGENVPGIPGACATRKFTYLIRDPLPSPQVLRYLPAHKVRFSNQALLSIIFHGLMSSYGLSRLQLLFCFILTESNYKRYFINIEH